MQELISLSTYSVNLKQRRLEKPKNLNRCFFSLVSDPQSTKCSGVPQSCTMWRWPSGRSNRSWTKPQFRKTSFAFSPNTCPACMCQTAAPQTRNTLLSTGWKKKEKETLYKLFIDGSATGQRRNLDIHFGTWANAWKLRSAWCEKTLNQSPDWFWCSHSKSTPPRPAGASPTLCSRPFRSSVIGYHESGMDHELQQYILLVKKCRKRKINCPFFE